MHRLVDIYDRVPLLDTTYVRDAGIHQRRCGVNSTKRSSNSNDDARVHSSKQVGVGHESGEFEDLQRKKRERERGEETEREREREAEEVEEAGGWRRSTKEDGSKERGNERNGSLWSSDFVARKKREAS